MGEMVIVDPRDGTDIASVPAYAWVPVETAHLFVGCSKRTVYRWVADDRLEVRHSGVEGKALHPFVRVGDVGEVFRRMRAKRHAERRMRPE